jgi:hypothetical protein
MGEAIFENKKQKLYMAYRMKSTAEWERGLPGAVVEKVGGEC